MFLQVVLLLPMIGNVLSESPMAFCAGVGKGTFCLPGLVGYRICADDTVHDGDYRFCRSHQQCRCGLNRRCEDLEKPICVDMDSPPDVPRTFSVQFDGRGNLHSAHGHYETIQTSGVVYQDLENQELCVKQILTTGSGSTSIIEKLYLKDPKSPHMWKKYTVTKHGDSVECKITQKHYFPEFFDDLLHFAYHEENNKWIYKDGPLRANEKSVEKEWILRRSRDGNLFPTVCFLRNRGSVQSKQSIMMRERFFNLVVGKPHSAWFSIPKKCEEESAASELDELDHLKKVSFDDEEKLWEELHQQKDLPSSEDSGASDDDKQKKWLFEEDQL